MSRKKIKKHIRWQVVMIIVLSVLLAAIGGYYFYTKQINASSLKVETSETKSTPTPESTPTSTPEPTPTPTVEAEYKVIDDAIGNSMVNGDDLLIIANKTYKLADGYEPDDLEWGYDCSTGSCYMRSPAAEAVREMIAAAAEDGITLRYSSAYRGESYQYNLYWGYVSKYGQDVADTISSRPGFSDHQTGLACDFISSTNSGMNFYSEGYAQTVEGIWLANNAYRFGFIQRYPNGKSDITGYSWESWHYRYIGVDYATQMHEEDPDNVNISMEEFFGFEGGDYKE